MEEKLLEIYNNSGRDKYVIVTLKDGRIIKCTADCFCTVSDEEDEDLDITHSIISYSLGWIQRNNYRR